MLTKENWPKWLLAEMALAEMGFGLNGIGLNGYWQNWELDQVALDEMALDEMGLDEVAIDRYIGVEKTLIFPLPYMLYNLLYVYMGGSKKTRSHLMAYTEKMVHLYLHNISFTGKMISAN